MLTSLYVAQVGTPGMTSAQIEDVVRNMPPDSPLSVLGILLGALVSVGAGYVCARIARRNEFLVGALMAGGVTFIGALMTDPDRGGTDLALLFMASSVACNLLGVKYGAAQNRRLETPAEPPVDAPRPMIARRVAIGLAFFGVLAAAAWWAVTSFMPQGFIDIGQAQLQQRLDTRFPQKTCAMGVACITLSSPVVSLTDGLAPHRPVG